MKLTPKETFETFSNSAPTNIDAIRSDLDEVEVAIQDAMAKGESVEVGMTIDENSLHHIMAVLSELYSDPKMAILREYATNAYDSHIQAGNPTPIQVTTPTPLAPVLRIQDFGVGLDAEDIVFVYSKYGLSTKTQTNDLTGVLGLGCKSAFTYTNQFTVIGVKHGIKTVCAVKRDEEGIGRIEIMDQMETDETNGVTVEIPAKRGDNFLTETNALFRFWPEGSVLVNEEPPERFKDGLKIADNIYLVKDNNPGDYDYTRHAWLPRTRNTLVMGNVPYPVDHDQWDFKLAANYFVVATVPNGTVHFTPSREALQYTTRTKAALEAVTEELQQGLVEAVNTEIKAAEDAPAALRVALRWRNVLPKIFREQSFTYKGVEIPDSIEAAKDGDRFIVCGGKKHTDYYGKTKGVGHHSRHATIELVTVPDAIWVYNFARTFTPVVKKKLWQYCGEQGIDYPENFILCEDKPTSPWIEPDKMILWDPIELIKLPRIARATGRNMTGRIPGSYDMLLNVDGDMTWDIDTPADDIDANDLTIFYSTSDAHDIDRQAQRLAKILDDFVLVQLTPNRIAKFCRFFPSAMSYRDAMIEYATEWYSFLTVTDIELLSMHNGVNLTSLDQVPALVADPALRRAKRLKDYKPDYCKYLQDIYRVFGDVQNTVHVPVWQNPIDRYPLCKTAFYYDDDKRRCRRHNRIYINAAYCELYASEGAR